MKSSPLSSSLAPVVRWPRMALPILALIAASAWNAVPAAAVVTTFVLTVKSVDPVSGVAITAKPADNSARTSGSTTFTLTYDSGTTVVLTAPAKSGTNLFSAWTGCTSVSTVTCTVALKASATVTATYAAPPKVTPKVTVALSSDSITTLESLSVKIAVTAPGGDPTPAGSIKITSGSYASAAVTLVAGDATVAIPADSLAAGKDTLLVTYTPSSADGVTYNSASAAIPISVAKITPRAAITLSSASISTLQPLSVKVAVTAATGDPIPAGTVKLTSGKYASAATTLSGGDDSFTLPAGTLPAGTNSLTATYTPSAADAPTYNSATATASVVVSKVSPKLTLTPSAASIAATQPLTVKIAVTAPTGDPIPAGTVKLTSGKYTSAAATLTAGDASVTIPASTLPAGTDSLVATYTPNTSDAATYNGASASTSIAVTAEARLTPTVAVTTSAASIGTEQALTVGVKVSGPAGEPAPAGAVVFTSGTYSSAATALTSGAASVVLPAGTLTAGTDTFKATYTPTGASAGLYNAASGTSPAVTVFAQSLVTVNPAVTGPAITDKLLGMNMAYWYDQSTPAILSAFQTAGIKAIRWPGGSGSDVYHWQTNSLCGGGYTVPADSFPSPLVTELWSPASLDVAITANYGTNAACNGPGEPSEAAAWVASALKNGNYVSHWTVGNEVYGSWETDMHTVKNDPTTYANAVATGYYPQMKAANANTLVGVVVEPNNNPPWDPIVMAKAKYDFVEYHFYPQAPGQESDTYLVQQAAQDLTTNLNAVKADLAQYGKAGTPIYVGEIGSVYTDPGKQSSSITQALYAGQVLGEMMNAGVSRATWWIGFGGCSDSTSGNFSSSLYGWQNFGGYMVFSDGTPEYGCENATSTAAGTLLPTARAFQLFSQIAVSGENVLPAKVAGDTHDVRAYAATSSGGTALLLFNVNETTSQNVLVEVTGQTTALSVTVETYDKTIYDQSKYNVWAPPTTTSLGAKSLPFPLTLAPWSMNVVMVK